MVETLSEHRRHGGVQGFYRHESRETGTPMQCAVYLPPAAERGVGTAPMKLDSPETLEARLREIGAERPLPEAVASSLTELFAPSCLRPPSSAVA